MMSFYQYNNYYPFYKKKMKEKTEKIFFYIAVGGFISAVAAHVLSLFEINLQAIFPPVFLLHIIIFVVWIPAVLKMNRIKKEHKAKTGEFPKITIRNLGKYLNYTPKIVLIAPIFFMIYAGVNFYIFMMIGEGGGPNIMDGKYVISNHGNIIREITAVEYQKFQANEIRGFSGLWMAFYTAAVAILFPKKGR